MESSLAQQIFKEEMGSVFANQPLTREFHCGEWFDEAYYARHLIECVNRITLNNKLDSSAVTKALATDNVLAKKLAYYLQDELCHDELFLHDLEKMGISAEKTISTPTFFSTDLLMGYLALSVERDGPLAAIVWDWVVEFYASHYNSRITEKAAKFLGKERVKGAKSHLNTDETEDHPGLMFEMVQRAIKTPADEIKTQDIIRRSVHLIGLYFVELSNDTNARLNS